MTENNLFYYPYASFTNGQLPLLKVAALWFDKLVILDPVVASWDTDLLVQVETQSLDDVGDSGIVILTGETTDGILIEGSDLVVIVPPE